MEMFKINMQFFGGRGNSTGGGGAAGGAAAVKFTDAQKSMIKGGAVKLTKQWLKADEAWAKDSDPEDVAWDIYNTEVGGRGSDVDLDEKLGDFEDSFKLDFSKESDFNKALKIAKKLQKASNKNLLKKFPEVKKEYDALKKGE